MIGGLKHVRNAFYELFLLSHIALAMCVASAAPFDQGVKMLRHICILPSAQDLPRWLLPPLAAHGIL